MECFPQAHVLQHFCAAPSLPRSPANAREFPLCVEPPELENHLPPWGAKGREPHAVLLNRTPSLCVSPQPGAWAAHKASSLGEENETCLVFMDVQKGIYIAWSLERGGKTPQSIGNLEENSFSGDLFGFLGERANIIIRSFQRL